MTDSLSRREILAYSAAFGSAFLAAQGIAAADDPKANKEEKPKEAPAAKEPGKKYEMKKSINLWAFPYPQKMTLKECFQLCKDAGFDGVEVNYALEGDLSPETSDAADQSHRRHGPQDRHRDQRRLLVPVLAVCLHA